MERITEVDPITGEKIRDLDELIVFPATHYMADTQVMNRAIKGIEKELQESLKVFEKENKLLESQRLRMRTEYDLEMMSELGFCSGIENYSAHIDGRKAGERPFTLLDYFPDDFLVVLDESHVAIPQLHGQHEGDRSRKLTLIEHGFRLPSAADNRPLRFDEFIDRIGQMVLVSATPGKWESDDLLQMISSRVDLEQRVLVTTLTKKMAEDLTDYLLEQGVRVRYLHSDIDTIERIEILRDLRLGEFDVLVGINLLREGLDLPEVSLVAILDADKEGFLRSETSLIQTIGRAARNVDGQVIMYADKITGSMKRALEETKRRRYLQTAYNKEHGIDPQTIRKAVSDILEMVRPGAASNKVKNKKRTSVKLADELSDMPREDLRRLVHTLEEEMTEAAEELQFEYAARLRDEIKELKREIRDMPEKV